MSEARMDNLSKSFVQQPPPASQRRPPQQRHPQAFDRTAVPGGQCGGRHGRPTRIDVPKQLPAQRARLLRLHRFALVRDRRHQQAAVPVGPPPPGHVFLEQGGYGTYIVVLLADRGGDGLPIDAQGAGFGRFGGGGARASSGGGPESGDRLPITVLACGGAVGAGGYFNLPSKLSQNSRP